MGVYGGGVYGAGLYGGGPDLAQTTQAVYPPRVLLSATGLVAGQLVTIGRVPAGDTVRTPVRGADETTMTTSALVRADGEAPFGVSLTYWLTINGVDVDFETVSLTLPGGNVVVSDAISADAVELVISSWPEKDYDIPGNVYTVGGRNILVSQPGGGFTGTIEFFVDTDDARTAVVALLRGATSGIVQLRQAGPYNGVDAYLGITRVNEVRFSQDGTDDRRLVVADVVEVGPWGGTLESSTFTLQDIANHYAGGTLQDIADDFAATPTLLAIALGDFS